jgi:hypothetical protein
MGRRELLVRTAWDDAYSTIAYTADALALASADGDKQVGDLADRVEKLLAQWDALDVERRAKRRAVGRAHALVRRRDIQADSLVVDLHHDTMALVRQDREAPLFTRLFPDPLSTVVRMALESELPILRTLKLKLEESETPAPLKKSHSKPLALVIEKGTAAIQGREEAFAAAGRVSAQIASWREGVNATMLGIEGVLKQVASERNLGAEWVDTFFPAAERGKKSKKEKAAAKPA